jgi:hypothetical protein
MRGRATVAQPRMLLQLLTITLYQCSNPANDEAQAGGSGTLDRLKRRPSALAAAPATLWLVVPIPKFNRNSTPISPHLAHILGVC